MRGLVLMTVLLAGVAAAQAAPDTDGTGATGAGAEAGRSGGHHTGKHKHRAVEAQAAPGPAQPHGMVGGTGGPGGAACAGGRGDTSRAKHRSSNRHRLDPLAEAMGSRHGGVRCVERF